MLLQTQTPSPQNQDHGRVLQTIVELGSVVGLEGLVGGQIVDMWSEGKQVSLEELEHKTSKLLEAAVVCGAKALRKYARCIGLLFQVVDDIYIYILDVTKSSGELGKTVGKDLATYPRLMGLHKAKDFAGELLAKAVQELASFDTFYHLAHYIASRQD